MMIRKRLLICLCIVVSGCANRVTPTGGAKDVRPPVLLQAVPPDHSANVKPGKVVIYFDELIDLKDLQKQLIISPIISPAPEITVKKKTLIINLPDSLEPNTTYTLNFGNAIADLHEGNAIESFQYVFSTGPVVDSFAVTGNAVDAFKKTGEKGISILMYRAPDDSLPFKRKPDYFTKSDENGNFAIRNVGEGKYMIVALRDKNENYICDSPADEAISLQQAVSLPDSSTIQLEYFNELPSSLYIKQISYGGNKRWNIIMNSISDSLFLRPSGLTHSKYLNEWSAYFDTVSVWCADTIADSLNLYIQSAKGIVDTAGIKLKVAVSSRGRGEAVKVSMIENSNASPGLLPGIPLQVLFRNPVAEIKNEKVTLQSDNINLSFKYSFTDSLKRNLKVIYDFIEDKEYRLIFNSGALKDFAGISNDSIAISFRAIPAKELASLTVKLHNTPPGINMLELVNENYVTVKQVKLNDKETILMEGLQPGKYRLRILNDRNNNGRWDTGSYFKNREPEDLYYFDGEINARANWEMEQDWTIIK